jgi:methionyl-tRNA synthetase
MGHSDRKTFYITTAISYTNGPPHLGHAYEAISTDAIARFKRLDGFDVKFLTGTDEHGQKVAKTAEEAGMTPRDFSKGITAQFQDMCRLLDISNDDFIRTTEQRHLVSTQALWQRLAEAGDIYLDKYAGWYSVRDEAYFGEEELTTDEAGRRLAPTGAEVEWVEEESYFFRLSAYGDKLLRHYEENPSFILPAHRRNEVANFVKQGLRDLSISRTSFDWGIPVPGDDQHIMYVWLDALTNYITALGFPVTEGNDFARYWPADIHVIGKDIVRFHAIYWPAFLMSAGVALPKRVFGHGFLFVDGEKMSKSLGNVVTPASLVEAYGLDQIRYFLLREVPYGSDGSFSHETITQRVNSDLANDLGNLAQRVLSMIAKNCDGAVPAPGEQSADDEALLTAARGALEQTREAMERQAIHRALEAIWQVVAAANRYVDTQAPWALAKSDRARMASVLYVLAEVIRQVATLTQPVMPTASGKILDQLAVPAEARTFAALGRDDVLVPGTALPKPKGVFPRYVQAEAAEER